MAAIGYWDDCGNRVAQPPRLVLGLISGTSADGIDAALVRLQGPPERPQPELVGADTYAYEPALQARILAAASGTPLSAEDWATLDDDVANAFAEAANHLQQRYGAAELIGSHGQTVFHRPPRPGSLGVSWQLGRGAAIARAGGLPVVADFRRADLEAGGQGAPLVPAVDARLLAVDGEVRCIQNLGGIGNVTWLPRRAEPDWLERVRGWDTGPANSLLDLAVHWLSDGQRSYDADGAWARQGRVHDDLLQSWLADDYFTQAPPKSTGRERFGWLWLEHQMNRAAYLEAADWLATLTEFTAASIALEYERYLPQAPDRVLLCGGGARNGLLRERLQARLGCPVERTDDYGLDSDAKEAIAFAVLAWWRVQGFPGNLPAVTGAASLLPLGELFQP